MKKTLVNMIIAIIVAIALYFGYAITIEVLGEEEAPAEMILDPIEEAVLAETEDAFLPSLDVGDTSSDLDAEKD